MHELSYVTHLISTLEDFADKNQIKSILTVSITVGEATMVVPRYLIECYNEAKKESELLKNSQLFIEFKPIKVRCRDCKNEFDEMIRVCPICGGSVDIIQGNEFEIEEISL